MPRRFRAGAAFRLAALALSLLALPVLARATWSTDPNVGNPIGLDGTTAALFGGPHRICPDASGGFYVAWSSTPGSGYRARVQHVRADGTLSPGWPSDGLRVTTIESTQTEVQLTPDAAGGALIAFSDDRSGTTDVYVQRIAPDGTRMWGTGLAVAVLPKAEEPTSIAPDGSGGCFVAWSLTYEPGDHDAYVHHVLANGTLDPAWLAGGFALASSSAEELAPQIIADASGGFWATWYDLANFTDYDVKVVHRTGTTALAAGWSGSLNPAIAALNHQYLPMLQGDGNGGAYVFWTDLRAGNSDVFGTYYAGGSALTGNWTSSGIPVVGTTDHQSLRGACSDGAGGVYVLWEDSRSSAGILPYLQHLRADGLSAPGWPYNGQAAGFSNCIMSSVVADGQGGAIVLWRDYATTDLYAARVRADGGSALGWAYGGAPLATAPGAQVDPIGIPDGNGGAYVTWWDGRSPGSYGHYAQAIDRFGALGNAAPALTSVRDVRPDQGGQVQLRWNASYLDAMPAPSIGAYWIWRQVNAGAPSGAARAGATGAWVGDDDDATALAAQGQRVLAASRSGMAAAAGYAWEYLSSQPANASASYSYIAATVTDSVAGANPRTVFMVEAHSASGSAFWASAPDSGYSVDNLAPPTPAPFAGTYSGGSTSMTWGAVSVADLAGYRLYRGGSLGFTPSLSNLIASPSSVAYTDAAGGPFIYKLTAVDVHGNESAPATLVPGGTAGVEDATPRALEFAVAGANPSRGGATLRFALPSAGHVRVAVYDAQGRRVRTLLDGVREAGRFETRWDGTDASGARVGAGLYFARLERSGETRGLRLVMTR